MFDTFQIANNTVSRDTLCPDDRACKNKHVQNCITNAKKKDSIFRINPLENLVVDQTMNRYIYTSCNDTRNSGILHVHQLILCGKGISPTQIPNIFILAIVINFTII